MYTHTNWNSLPGMTNGYPTYLCTYVLLGRDINQRERGTCPPPPQQDEPDLGEGEGAMDDNPV